MNLSRFIVLMFTVLFGTGTVQGAPVYQDTILVELFTTIDNKLPSEPTSNTKEPHQGIDFHAYQLDQIQLVENALSNNLPVDPKRSKQIVMQRFQQLDAQTITAFQNTAVGLAKAMQYGIDRYPAIVFDGKAVIYGLTDVDAALDHYRTWQTGTKP